jgi:hypothetical protein
MYAKGPAPAGPRAFRRHNLFEYVPEKFAAFRIPRFGQKIQKGFQGENPFGKTGMGNFKIVFPYHKIAKKKYVDIKGPFPPAPFAAPIAAVTGLYSPYVTEQFAGIAAVKTGNGGIEKRRLINNMERFRLADSRLS